MQVTDVSINVFDKECKLVATYNSNMIKGTIFSDSIYMYCYSAINSEPITKVGDKKPEWDLNDVATSPGLYIYNISDLLLKGKTKPTRLRRTLAGVDIPLSFNICN